MSTVSTLPHWDMSVVYPGLDSPAFEQGFARVLADIEDLEQYFDAHAIMEKAHALSISETVQTFEETVARLNAIMEKTLTLNVYITCFVHTNTQDTLAQAKASELQPPLVTLRQLDTRFTAWIGGLDVEALREHTLTC